MMKITLFIIFFAFTGFCRLISQFSITEEQSSSFFFDAVCFKNDSLDKSTIDGRIDIFALIPYQILTFEKKNDIFGAKYDIFYDVYDSSGQKIKNEKSSGIIAEKDYYVTQGGTAGFERASKRMYLNAGKYEINITIVDLLSGNSYKKTRSITIINFNKFRIAVSGLMLISSIEEKDSRYVITPHISDNVGMLPDGFFVFFEVYNNNLYDSLDFIYELNDEKGDMIYKSEKFSENVKEKTTRHYKKVRFPENTPPGIYKIRMIALKSNGNAEYTNDDYLAITERTLKFQKSSSGNILGDITQSIRYLRYVAEQSDIEYIEEGTNESEKQKRFEDFWKNLDPSPNTERNEAFEQYYLRIEFANKNYKSYTEGWLTDMGMVYIIFGPPDYVDMPPNTGSRTQYVKWSYMNNRQFIFADDTGIGDYRLTRQYLIAEKYKYR